jgi:hypothetical protein
VTDQAICWRGPLHICNICNPPRVFLLLCNFRRCQFRSSILALPFRAGELQLCHTKVSQSRKDLLLLFFVRIPKLLLQLNCHILNQSTFFPDPPQRVLPRRVLHSFPLCDNITRKSTYKSSFAINQGAKMNCRTIYTCYFLTGGPFDWFPDRTSLPEHVCPIITKDLLCSIFPDEFDNVLILFSTM